MEKPSGSWEKRCPTLFNLWVPLSKYLFKIRKNWFLITFSLHFKHYFCKCAFTANIFSDDIKLASDHCAQCQVRQVRVAAVVVVLSVHVGQQPSNPTTRTNFRHNLLQRVAFHTWAEKREKKVKIKVKTSIVEKSEGGATRRNWRRPEKFDLNDDLIWGVEYNLALGGLLMILYVYNNRGTS